jgi:hypothetical protein
MWSMTGIYAEKPFQIATWDSGESGGYAGKHKGIPVCGCRTKEAMVKLSLHICLLIAAQGAFMTKGL